MMHKSTIAVLAAALMLGTASIAQASDNDSGDYHGGFKVGPLGQRMGGRGFAFGFGGPRLYRHWGGNRSYAFVPGHPRMWRHEWRHEY